jgi:Mg2+/Co2+ transporter CorC
MRNPLSVSAVKHSASVFRLVPHVKKRPLSGEDAAIELLRDFTCDDPLTIRSALGVQEAKEKLYSSDSTFSVVINRDDDVVGILALKDLIGSWPLSLASQRGGSIADIAVQDVMRPIWSLPAITYSQLQDLKIGELVSSFNELHSDYLLVQDAGISEASESFVRGLLSADELSQQLGIQLSQDALPESFSDIVHAVRGKSG